MPKYLKNNKASLAYSNKHSFNLDKLEEAVKFANKSFVDAYKQRHKFDPANYIPFRNISGGVGEAFAAVLCELDKGMIGNPHSDGYPDILPVIAEAKDWLENPTKKEFTKGGFDVKSKYTKPKEKVDTNASAHHTYTKSILNVIWEWRDDVPFIIGLTYCNTLGTDDWGKLGQIKAGSKSSPAAALSKAGKKKLRNNWLLLDESVVKRIHKREDWTGL